MGLIAPETRVFFHWFEKEVKEAEERSSIEVLFQR